MGLPYASLGPLLFVLCVIFKKVEKCITMCVKKSFTLSLVLTHKAIAMCLCIVCVHIFYVQKIWK